MEQYSQQHLKVAATEPEHVVRKAEFDAVIESLGGTGGETLTDLATVDQSSLVAAINEIFWDQMDSKDLLAQTIGGVEYSTFAKMIQAAGHAKTTLAQHLTSMGVLGIADEPLQSLIDRIPAIPNGYTGPGQELLFREKLLAWCPFKPFPGIFTKTGIQPEGLYPSGGGNATGTIVNAQWNPSVGVKFQESWTRNNTANGALSLGDSRTNTIWWRPYIWPENMSIIRYGNGDGYSGSGIKVKNGRLVVMAEVLFTQEYNPNYNRETGDDYYLYTVHSTYVDLGPCDSVTYPPNVWHMLAVKPTTLSYYNSSYGQDQPRTVYEYYMDGVKIDIPFRTTGVWDSYDYYEKYPNAGGAEYIHLGTRVWSYGEPTSERNTPDYSGWFLDWRGYESLTDTEIAALYAAGPYQI
jgi:hypothetical protein